jgi:zinc/manganese transport system substrate-binding protein
MNRLGLLVLGIIAIALIIGLASATTLAPTSRGTLHIVAAENFWGSIASQIGGSKVTVQSVVSDPNADPHEYESNTATARAVATSNYVILNGAGYDSWAEKLLSASHNSGRLVLTVASLVGKHNGDNPHFWYNPTYVNQVAAQIQKDLSALDPADANYFATQHTALQAKLAKYQNQILAINRQFAGTTVAATEDIFVYLAQSAGLNLVSPPAFIEAVAEGNDPPTQSVITFQQQLESGQVKLFVYNSQTVTPLTESMKQLAVQHAIPTVGISETVQPTTASFEDWMSSQLTAIQTALNSGDGTR